MIKVSVIIPCRTWKEAVRCYYECSKLSGADIEVIILPDYGECETFEKISFISTGPVLPSLKRDIGLKHATGEIIAFIDADAYPDRDWLQKAAENLNNDENLAGVCGPGILPPFVPWREKGADLALQIMPIRKRVIGRDMFGRKYKPHHVDDWPTFNLIFWKKDIDQVGGFACNYLTGEDSLLCMKIIQQGRKILYDPDVFVYHHRRELFVPFFRQIKIYGLHRGYFFKTHPLTSRRILYALPTIIWGLICGLFLCVLHWFCRH